MGDNRLKVFCCVVHLPETDEAKSPIIKGIHHSLGRLVTLECLVKFLNCSSVPPKLQKQNPAVDAGISAPRVDRYGLCIVSTCIVILLPHRKGLGSHEIGLDVLSVQVDTGGEIFLSQ